MSSPNHYSNMCSSITSYFNVYKAFPAPGSIFFAMTSRRDWIDALDSHIAPDFANAALLIIDMQVDFVDGGSSPIGGTSAVIPQVAALRAAFLNARKPVVHVVRLYDGDDVDRVRRTALAAGALVVRPGSVGAQVVPELRDANATVPDAARLLAGDVVEVAPGEVVLWKPRWSAFHRTRLHQHLTDLGMTTVVVTGCNFPNCPRATAFGASERDYRVVIPTDAVSGLKEMHQVELAGIGVVHADTAHIIGALG